jgi:hypothetical protein
MHKFPSAILTASGHIAMKESTTREKKIQYTGREYSLLKRHDQTRGETADDCPRRFSIKNYLIIGHAFLDTGTHKRGLSRQQKAQPLK